MIAQTWEEFFTELWHTEIWSWDSLISGFVLALAVFVLFILVR